MASPGISYDVPPRLIATMPPPRPAEAADTTWPGLAPARFAVTATRLPSGNVRIRARLLAGAVSAWTSAGAATAEDAERAAACGASGSPVITEIAAAVARPAAIAAGRRGREVTFVSLGKRRQNAPVPSGVPRPVGAS